MSRLVRPFQTARTVAAAALPHVAAQAVLGGSLVCREGSSSASSRSQSSSRASTVVANAVNRIVRRGRSEPQAAGPSQQQPQQQKQQQQDQQQEHTQQPHLKQPQQPSNAEPQTQQPILIALGTTSAAAAKAVIMQLRTFGSAEVWATSSANHFTAVQALAEAHCLLAGQQQQQQQRQGLAATAQLSASDQAVADDQKRGLRKLTLHVQLTPAPVDEAVWAPGAANHLSTNRIRAVAELVEAMQVQLGSSGSNSADSSSAQSAAAGGSSSSSSSSSSGGGCVVLEARGEQAVTRALKAVLSLQAVQQGRLLLAPWAGPVVDVVAEKRGEQRTAGGLLLHVSWQDAAQ
uniref:Uncharacterized protein n=1 Tax=Tetradesmus obliquus TaxID=3088 RepID=A0A383WHQ0_TETOB